MSIQHVLPVSAPPGREPQAMLFTPGARLGWIFRDRRTLLAPYPQPEPDLQQLRDQAAAATAALRIWLATGRLWLLAFFGSAWRQPSIPLTTRSAGVDHPW